MVVTNLSRMQALCDVMPYETAMIIFLVLKPSQQSDATLTTQLRT
jgi:hypothetical protein